MTDNPTAPATPAAPATDATPEAPANPNPSTPGRDAPETPLGEPGLRALQAEREARERLEREVGPLREQWTALQRVFGGESTEGRPEDVVARLSEQVAAMQHSTLVNDVARRHGITDDEDVALLREVRDEAQMTRLAARLNVPKGPSTPAPDPGQGARPSTPQAEADAEYAKFFPTR